MRSATTERREAVPTGGNDVLAGMLAPKRATWKWVIALALAVIVCVALAYGLWGHRGTV